MSTVKDVSERIIAAADAKLKAEIEAAAKPLDSLLEVDAEQVHNEVNSPTATSLQPRVVELRPIQQQFELAPLGGNVPPRSVLCGDRLERLIALGMVDKTREDRGSIHAAQSLQLCLTHFCQR